MIRTLLALCLALVACEADQADIDTGDPDELPDLAGSYMASALVEPEGCDAFPEADPTWLAGPLEITGAAPALTFGFSEGAVLTGDADAAFTFTAAGTVTDGATDWVVDVGGLAFLGDSGWNLDGDMVAEVSDSTSGTATCTLSGRLEAVQDPP